MNDNASRRLVDRKKRYWEDQYMDEKVHWDHLEDQKRYDHEEWKRKKYLIKDGHLPGPWNRYGSRHGSRYGSRWGNRHPWGAGYGDHYGRGNYRGKVYFLLFV